MLTIIFGSIRARLAALRAYRRALVEIEALSHAELIGMQSYRSDMRAAARRAFWR